MFISFVVYSLLSTFAYLASFMIIMYPLSKMGIASSSPTKNYYFVIYIMDGNGKFIGNSSSMKITY